MKTVLQLNDGAARVGVRGRSFVKMRSRANFVICYRVCRVSVLQNVVTTVRCVFTGCV